MLISLKSEDKRMAKILPHSMEAEKSVLGAIFLDPTCTPTVIDMLHEHDFYDTHHMVIYQAIKDLYQERKEIDYTTVAAKLTSKGQLEEIGGLTVLIELSNYTVSLEHLETYIQIVKDNSLKRDVIRVTQELSTTGLTSDVDASLYLDRVEEQILALSQRRKVGVFKPVPQIVSEVKEKMKYLQHHKGGISGLTTGFATLDAKINGLQKEELIIIAARPSMGKSAFAMNIAFNAAKLNKGGKAGVAIFSLEMSNEQLVTRMISSMTNIDNSKLRTGYLTPQEWKHFENQTDVLNSLNIYFDDSSSINIGDIRAKCRRLAQEGKLDLVVIDYLQLIKGDERSSNRQEEVSRISRSLKQMAKELKVPVIALSQLSRDVEKTDDKRPVLAHLRESGSIEQDADIVMFIHRDDYYARSKEPTGDAEIIIAKNRQGSIGTVNFLFASQHSRFTERSANFDEPLA